MTEQYKDFIKFNGDEYLLDQYPLESYFDQSIRLRPDFSLIDFRENGSLTINSACHRGYIAIWEIRNNKLFLQDIISPEMTKSLKNLIFKAFVNDGLIEASWFSGLLTLNGFYDRESSIKKIIPPDPKVTSSKITEPDYWEYLYSVVGEMEASYKIELMFEEGELISQYSSY